MLENRQQNLKAFKYCQDELYRRKLLNTVQTNSTGVSF